MIFFLLCLIFYFIFHLSLILCKYNIVLKWRNICFGSIILALSVSIDSLGIGITYGIKNTSLNFFAKFILIVMSVSFSACSIFIGNVISLILSDFLTKFISSFILVIIGIIVLIDPIPFDFDNSCNIDMKEAFLLGIALSLDSISVGIGSSIGGYSNIFFPIFSASFQLLFLSLGIFIGKKIVKKTGIPDKTWNFISGTVLILFGFIKFLV